MNKLLRTVTIILTLPVLLSGCASTGLSDVFSGYAHQMSDARNAAKSGNFQAAEKQVAVRSASDGTYALSQLELGRLQYLSNNWSHSQKTFDLAYQNIQEEEAKAKLQISRGLENVGAMVTNDNALRYDVPYYEQSMLHTYQALNYLYEQGLESALVEVRRANLVQQRALEENQESIDEARGVMENYGVSQDALSSSYPSMLKTIGNVKNGFQNAYTFYLSGLLYEAAGEKNDAYIDYKKALEIFPDNSFLQQDVLRLSKKLGMSDDFSRYKKLYGEYTETPLADSGQVVIVYEAGLIEAKDEVALNIPLYGIWESNRIISFSLPVYHGQQSATTPLAVSYNDKSYQSEQIVRLQSLAAKELDENLPGLVVRQLLRIMAKEEMRHQMTKEAGDFGNLLATIYNIASERADTRSWSTLPDNVQILKMNMSKGEQQLAVNVNGQTELIDIKVNPNRITLINLTNIGNYTGYQTINL